MTKQTEIEPTLASAMAAAFADIQSAMKDSKNPHFKSKYADITAVIEAIKPALVKHQLFFTQRPEPVERGVQVETVLHHANGEMLSLGKLFVPANKQDAQGLGSALTYARRYALVTAFGVPVEDDDGHAAAKSYRQAEGQSKESAVSPPPADYAWPEGPATGITALKGMVRELWRDVNACGDEDSLTTLLAEPSTKAVMEQCDALENPTHREIWAGDGKDNPGLFTHIQKRRAEFATQNLNAG